MDFGDGEVATKNLPKDMVPSLEKPKGPTPPPKPAVGSMNPARIPARTSRPVVPVISISTRPRVMKKMAAVDEDMDVDSDSDEVEFVDKTLDRKDKSAAGKGSSGRAKGKGIIRNSGTKRGFQESPTRAKVPAKRARVGDNPEGDDLDLRGFIFNEDSELDSEIIPLAVGKVSFFSTLRILY